MNWTVIQKTPNTSLNGNYRNPAVKTYLREEGGQRCVYCAVHENKVGGERAFHVEHYRPKSLEAFRHLEHDLSNLFYSCPICNTFKSNTWPGEPTAEFDCASYPDPSAIDYTVLFEVQDDGTVMGRFEASRYIVSQLYFNRPQLILERRQHALDQRFDALKDRGRDIGSALQSEGTADALPFLSKLLNVNERLAALLRELHELPLYEPEDVRRQR